jgi:hypothetical protein
MAEAEVSYQCELTQERQGRLWQTLDWVKVKDLEMAAAKGVPVANLPGLWTAVHVYRKLPRFVKEKKDD